MGEVKVYVGNVLWVTPKGSDQILYTFLTLFSVEIAEEVCTMTANCP